MRIDTLGIRIRLTIIFGALAIFALSGAAPAHAQNPDTIPAEESAARTKTILQQMIGALGGAAYLNLHDLDALGG